MEWAITINEPTEENAVPVASEEQTKESNVENKTLDSRRGCKAAPTPKTNTPKPVGRPRRKPPQSEPEIQPEVIKTVEAPPLPSAKKKVPEEEPSEESSSNMDKFQSRLSAHRNVVAELPLHLKLRLPRLFDHYGVNVNQYQPVIKG